MSRFDRRLARRLERDLDQIADRATPSSTAWEAIRHRIDEQDTERASAPTSEVIMLDPNTNRLLRRRPTGLLVAAGIAAIALVGGLVIVANRDGESPPADQPAPTTTDADESTTDDSAVGRGGEDAGSEPAVVPAPDGVGEGEVLPGVDLPTSGTFIPECTFGDAVPAPDGSRIIVEQDCTIVATGSQPFAAEQVLELSLLETLDSGPAGVFLSLGDNGFMNAGLLWDEGTEGRWVGIAEGVGAYEGQPVYLSAISSQNADGSLAELDGRWWTTDGPRPMFDDVEVTAEFDIWCTDVESPAPGERFPNECVFSGPGVERFLPDSAFGSPSVIPADFGSQFQGPNSVAGSDFLIIEGEDGAAISGGLVTDSVEARWSELRLGVGEFEGSLIAIVGWGEFDRPYDEPGAVLTGTVQLTVLPGDA